MIRFLEWLAGWLARSKMKKHQCKLENCGDKQVFCITAPENHRRCRTCSRMTSTRSLWIDPTSLKRKIVYRCYVCQYAHSNTTQDRLCSERTRKDWSQVTTPVNGHILDPSSMDDQYVGVIRETIRAFFASEDEFATVTSEVSPSALQRSIEILGLDDEMYAEQRNETTVLRRILK